jgi:hypothetical protein
VDILSVNHRWAKSITDTRESLQFIPHAYTVQELVDILELTKHPHRLHLVVMGVLRAAEAETGAGAKDRVEGEDTVGNINPTFSRMNLIISRDNRV